MLRSFLLSLAVVLLLTCSVRADNLIIAGSFTSQGSTGPLIPHFLYNFSGNNFSTGGVMTVLPLGSVIAPDIGCRPCRAGASFTLGTLTNHHSPSDFLSGSITINGQTFFFVPFEGAPLPLPEVRPQAFMDFFTPQVTLPATGESTITLTAPFTMRGFTGWLQQNLSLFSFPFSGEGIANAVFVSAPQLGDGRYLFQSVTYKFTEPTPEPASIVLLCSGLAGLGVRLRKRIW